MRLFNCVIKWRKTTWEKAGADRVNSGLARVGGRRGKTFRTQ
ncbi:hypothetical protein VPHD479_0257 [Vibrio phage D479]